MRKTLQLLSVILLSAGSVLAQDVVTQETPQEQKYQEQSKIRLNAGLVYGSNAGLDKGAIGLNVGGEYFITEKISAAPSFTYFFKSKVETSSSWGSFTSSVQSTSINLDGRYYFAEKDAISFYGLAGIAVASVKAKVENSDGKVFSEASDSKAGLNIGAGLIYPYSEKFSLNAQIKYNTPLEQFAIQAGVTIPLNL